MARFGAASLFLFLSFLTGAWSADDVYNPCFRKNSQSIHEVSGVACLAVAEHTLICHDPERKILKFPEGYKAIKYDPFTRIYEVESAQTLQPVAFKPLAKIATSTELALIDTQGYRLGRVESYANGFDRFGRFSLGDTLGKVIGAKCYTVVGIGTLDDRYIPSEFIQSFLAGKTVRYGDIGIRMKEQKGRFFVAKRDTFFPENPFEEGDEIVSLNGNRYERFDALSFTILFAPIGTLFDVTIKRDGELHRFKVKSGIRFGGGYQTDTFLERFGLIFDTNLTVESVTPGSYADQKGIKAGDRLLQFDGVAVNSVGELTELISQKRTIPSSILFDRDDFQFFFSIY